MLLECLEVDSDAEELVHLTRTRHTFSECSSVERSFSGYLNQETRLVQRTTRHVVYISTNSSRLSVVRFALWLSNRFSVKAFLRKWLSNTTNCARLISLRRSSNGSSRLVCIGRETCCLEDSCCLHFTFCLFIREGINSNDSFFTTLLSFLKPLLLLRQEEELIRAFFSSTLVLAREENSGTRS